MRILKLHPATRTTGGGFRQLARFDAQVASGVRMYGLELVQTPDGRHIVYAQQARNGRAATFDIATGDELAAAVIAAMKGDDANDDKRAA